MVLFSCFLATMNLCLGFALAKLLSEPNRPALEVHIPPHGEKLMTVSHTNDAADSHSAAAPITAQATLSTPVAQAAETHGTAPAAAKDFGADDYAGDNFAGDSYADDEEHEAAQLMPQVSLSDLQQELGEYQASEQHAGELAGAGV